MFYITKVFKRTAKGNFGNVMAQMLNYAALWIYQGDTTSDEHAIF